MGKKAKILVTTYVAAAIAALGIYSWVSHNSLADYRLAAKYSSNRAFEETVNSVSALSDALEKSVYASDGSMCSKVCSEVYANALAAETAMSTMPFSSYELEQVSAFLNQTGDYAYTLCSQAAAEGFSQEQVETLTRLSATAAEFEASLRETQSGLNGGDIIMDSREQRLENVGQQDEQEKLSARLLAYEEQFQRPQEPEYDGKYSSKSQEESKSDIQLTRENMLELAAEYAGVDKEQVKQEYEYQGESGRRCYSAGELLICISPGGFESMSQSRLVGESNISVQQAQEKAEEFLQARGYESIELVQSGIQGALACFEYCRVEDEALCLDNKLRICVAMDDGSIYSLDASSYSTGEYSAQWTVDEDTAAQAVPESLELEASRRIIIKSPGGMDLACYEFSCTAENSQQVKIYVDAATGKQYQILISPQPQEESQEEKAQPQEEPQEEEAQPQESSEAQ